MTEHSDILNPLSLNVENQVLVLHRRAPDETPYKNRNRWSVMSGMHQRDVNL